MTFRTLALLGCAAALALPLSACGRLGDLEKPSALNGADRATTRKADEKERQATDQQRPADTIDTRDRSIDPAPPRTLPIPGTNPDPSRSNPPCALPDPYSNPR